MWWCLLTARTKYWGTQQCKHHAIIWTHRSTVCPCKPILKPTMRKGWTTDHHGWKGWLGNVLPTLRDHCGDASPKRTHALTGPVKLVRSKLRVTECEMASLKRSIHTYQTISGVSKVVLLCLYRRNEAYCYYINSNLLSHYFHQK